MNKFINTPVVQKPQGINLPDWHNWDNKVGLWEWEFGGGHTYWHDGRLVGPLGQLVVSQSPKGSWGTLLLGE